MAVMAVLDLKQKVSKLKDLLYRCLMFMYMGLLVFVEVKPLNKKFK
jgi:hypothetical protein